MRLLDGLTTLALLTAAIPSAADEPAPLKKITTVEGITEYRLDNGLKVLLFPEPSRPKVTVDLTVFVGSRHEGYGEAGMAHLLEHMLFKGTPHHPNVPGALKERGAQFNGTTQLDETNYFETLNATVDNLDFALGLEADRLVHYNVKGEDLATEFSVVRNEFERNENSPSGVLRQRMMAVAYEWHNYGKSIVGNRSDIERVPIENLRAFYRKYYQPDNAVLVVAGQFDPAKALELIRKHFGPLPRPTRKLDPTYTEEPAQDGERSVTVRSLTHQQIVDRLDRDRAELTLEGRAGILSARLETWRKYLADVLDLLRQVLREPTLPADQFEVVRSEWLFDSESFRSDPQTLASLRLRQALKPYPKDDVRHVFSLDEHIERTKDLTLDQLKALHADYLGAGQVEVAVVGDFDPSEVTPSIARIFEGWKASRPYARIEDPYMRVEPQHVSIATPDKANATYMGGLTLPMRDEDPAYPAALIGNYVLGGGGLSSLSSRLADRLRQKDGVSYSVGSRFNAEAEDENASLMTFAIFNPANLAKVEAGVREEFDRLLRGGVTPDELDKARKGYLQQVKAGRTSDASLASTLANYLHLGRTLAFDVDLERKIQALTPDAVNSTVRKYLDPKTLTSVVAGDFKKAEPEKEGDAPK
jgi:predicted Zn-dependent peptidase